MQEHTDIRESEVSDKSLPSEGDPLSISLIICTYNRPGAISRLLEALPEQGRLPDEILVIDASHDSATEHVVRKAKDAWVSSKLSYYRAPERERGLTKQRNYGFARASGCIIAYLDDDTLPHTGYLQAVLSCFERHPQAAGVGGYITNEVTWKRTGKPCLPRLSTFCWRGWERREDFRWRLRKLLGLAGKYPPGWMPRFGHGRSVGFLPPDGDDYPVEFIMGGASAWRRDVLQRRHFSRFFEGYGLYEDLDFCIRVSRHHSLYLCTSAQLEHHHATIGRPGSFKYGMMVVRNGWYVWRQRWPDPARPDRLRWWAVTFLLTLSRLVDSARGPYRLQSLEEALGRLCGIVRVLWRAPQPIKEHQP